MNSLWKRCLAVMLLMSMILGLGGENFLVYAQENIFVQDEERGQPASTASEVESDMENEVFSFESSVDGTENLVELSAGKSYYLQIMLDSEIAIDARYTVNFSNDSGDSFSVEKTDRRNTNTTTINGLWIPFTIPDEAYGKYEVSVTVILANDYHVWDNEIIDVGISSEGNCGENLTWVLDSGGTLTISGTGEMYYFDETDSKEVPWQEMRQRIKSIVVEEGVTSIGDGAFDSGLPISSSRGSDSLKSVRMSDTITYIGSSAFARCNSLESISIPTGVKVINNSLFKKCKSLTSIEIPMGVTSIEAGAFDGCTRLENVIIPKGVTNIGSHAFSSCTKLTNVEFPMGITSIGDSAFEGCVNLTSLEIPEGFGSIYNGEYVFQDCTNLTYVETSSNVGRNFFRRCTKLEEVVLKSGVGKIGYRAFEDCESLKNIEMADTVTEIENYVFSGCVQIEEIHLPKNIQAIGGLAFSGVQNIKLTVDSQSNFLTLKDDILFSKDLKKLIYYPSWKTDTIYQIPVSVIEICQGAFSENDSLEVIRMHGNLKKIDSWAFANCSALKYSVIPEGVERIEYYVYHNCPQLEYLVCPSSVISYGDGGKMPTLGVDRCENLKKVYGYSGSLAEEFFPDKFESVDNGVVLTFDAHGGTVSEQSRRIYPCHAYQTLPVPVKAGYIFAGWYTDEVGGEQVTVHSLVESVNDYTLHARWRDSVSDISTCKIILSDDHFSYTGNTIIPDITVIDDDFVLTTGKEYTVSYSDNINAGEATITIKGIGTYTGTQIIHFTIEKATPTLQFISANMNKTLGDAAFTNKLTVNTDGKVTYSSSNPSVATVNESSGLVTLKGAGTANITANATEGQNYTSKSANYKLTVEQPPFSNLSSLTYSFGNSNFAFGYSTSYQIPLSSYQMVFSDVKAKQLYHDLGGVWGGSCYGMSSTSGMFNVKNSGMVIGDFNATANRVSDLKVADKNNKLDIILRTWIEAMHVSQYDSSVQRCFAYNEDLDGMCEEVNRGLPVIIGVWGPEGGHAIVGYKVEKISVTRSYLYVYDCNFPNQTRTVTLTTDRSGNCTGWYYHLNDMYDWGSNYSGCSIAYVPYSCYQAMWENSPAARQSKMPSAYKIAALSDSSRGVPDSSNMLIVNSDEFKVQEQSGTVVAEVKDGQLTAKKQDIYQFRPTDLLLDGRKKDEGEKTLIYLPTEAYMIKSMDNSIDKLEIGMVNENQSVNVTTTADDVTVHVDDNEKRNIVNIHADKGDSYEVVLNSSLENVKNMEEITVSGTAANNTVEVGMTENGCVLKNCTDIQMKINGQELGSTAGSLNDISKMKASLEYVSCDYDGKNKEPQVVLKDGSYVLRNGTDYVVVYNNNVEPGTATATVYGIVNYAGMVSLDYIIKGKDSNAALAEIKNKAKSELNAYKKPEDYRGTQKKELIKAIGDGRSAIDSAKDELSVKKALSDAKAVIDRIKTNAQLTEEEERARINISSCKVTLSKTSYTHDGRKKEPVVSIKAGKTKLIKNADYIVSYKNNVKVGTASIVISGKGKYTGKVTNTFKILPQGTSISGKITAKSKGFTVKWKKQKKSTTGYQIQYSTSRRFAKKTAVTKTVKKNSTTKLTVKNLKAKKKYYVRIRTYKTLGGKKYYSNWSKSQKVETKK